MRPICRLSDDPVQLVVDLLDESGQWNTQLVRDMFIASDADAILSMPRARVGIPDFWGWAWEKSESFMVRSACRMAMEKNFNLQNETSSSEGGEATWKALWKLQVQPEIRIFFCRVLKNMLPANGKLCRRHI